MAVRVLLAFAALVLLGSCGQASSPLERQEGIEEAAPPPATTTAPVTPTPEPIKVVPVGEPVGYNEDIVVWEIVSAEVEPGPRFNQILSEREKGPFLVMEVRFTNNSQEYLSANDCNLNLYTDLKREWLCTVASETVPYERVFDADGIAPGTTAEGILAAPLEKGRRRSTSKSWISTRCTAARRSRTSSSHRRSSPGVGAARPVQSYSREGPRLAPPSERSHWALACSSASTALRARSSALCFSHTRAASSTLPPARRKVSTKVSRLMAWRSSRSLVSLISAALAGATIP
jgi:hypothetical protein